VGESVQKILPEIKTRDADVNDKLILRFTLPLRAASTSNQKKLVS
jgi:hypothetical protein